METDNFEAIIPEAEKNQDFSPSHFELVQIQNLLALTDLGMKVCSKV